MLIGKGGSGLREMQEKTGVKVRCCCWWWWCWWCWVVLLMMLWLMLAATPSPVLYYARN